MILHVCTDVAAFLKNYFLIKSIQEKFNMKLLKLSKIFSIDGYKTLIISEEIQLSIWRRFKHLENDFSCLPETGIDHLASSQRF